MEQTSIKKSFGYQMAYEVLVFLLPLVTSPYIAQVIGAKGVGQYTYTYSVGYYFVLFSMLGISVHGRRSIARIRDNPDKIARTFSALLVDHVLVSLLCCLIYAGYVILLHDDKLLAIIQGAYVLSGLFDISWFYFGIEKFQLTVLCNSVIKIISVVCIFLFVRRGDDLWKYCAIMAFGTLLSQVALWLPLHRYVRIVYPSVHDMQVQIKPLLIMFIPCVAVSLYKYMDKIMIGMFSSKTQLGLYENAEKITTIPNSIIGAFGNVMMPKITYLMAKKDIRNVDRYMSLSMRYVMCLSFALAFGIAGIGKNFAPLFWGESFADAGVLIMGLAITIPFISFANVIRTQYLYPHSKDLLFNLSVISGAGINIIINRLLLPSMGAMGATIGTIAAEALVCIIQAVSIRKQVAVITYLKNSIPFMLFGSSMFVLVYMIGQLLNNSWKTLFIQIGVGVCIYVIACVIYFWLIKDDIIISIFQRIKRSK